MGNRTTSNAALRLCVFCRVLACECCDLGIHGKCLRLAIFLTYLIENIDLLLEFAGIIVKLHVELGFCGKEFDLYIVRLIELNQYIELQNSELAISHMNYHFFP